MARRRVKKRKLKKALYIVCEGKNTEPIYFKGLIERQELDKASYAYQVIVHDTPKTNPLGLIEVARELLIQEEDEAWVVYDKDGYTKHDLAFELAKEAPKVNIAFSSVAFEHWVLLHFERSEKSYIKSKNVIEHLRNRGYLRNYSKKNGYHLYPHLEKRTHIAIENAAWLRHRMYFSLQEAKGRYFEVNPYTTVDRLVGKLLNIQEKVIWVNAKEDIHTNNLLMCVSNAEQTGAALIVTLDITNKKPAGFIFNQGEDEVYIRDKHYRKIYPENTDKILIEKQTTHTQIYIFELSGKPEKYRFCIEVEKTKCIVQL